MPSVSILQEPKKELEIQKDQTIFESFQLEKIDLPHGCLRGNCGACKIEIISGNHHLYPPSELEEKLLTAIKVNLERIHGKDTFKNKNLRLSCQLKMIVDDQVRALEIKTLS